MGEGITGWRLHVGVDFSDAGAPRAVLEFYDAVPEGVDMTTVSLTIQQHFRRRHGRGIKAWSARPKQLANFDVDRHLPVGVRRWSAADKNSARARGPAVAGIGVPRSPTCRVMSHAHDEARDARHGDAVREFHH